MFSLRKVTFKLTLNEIMCLSKGSLSILPINVPLPFLLRIEIKFCKHFLDPASPPTAFGHPKR